MAVNCLNDQNKPCLECENCKKIKNGSRDIWRIDGATYTGVDNIRSVIEDCQYVPVDLRYKIYIIDEAHMLSRNAFNSLLKTLESPPEYVIFILITTDVEKIIDTIRSRSLEIKLDNIYPQVMRNYLYHIAHLEKLSISDEIVNLLIDSSLGSVRDVLSQLERVITGDLKNPDEVMKYLRIFSTENIIKVFKWILEARETEAFNYWIDARNNGYKETAFLNKMIKLVVDLMLTADNIIEDDRYKKILEEYEVDIPLLLNYFDILVRQKEILYSDIPSVIESTIVMMSHIQSQNPNQILKTLGMLRV
jgi:DNA polymerase-3 subunit gamma/tau